MWKAEPDGKNRSQAGWGPRGTAGGQRDGVLFEVQMKGTGSVFCFLAFILLFFFLAEK